jgi:hypothetical protein
LPTVNPTGSSTGGPQLTFSAPASSTQAVYVQIPAASAGQNVLFAVGATDPLFQGVSSPVGGAYDGWSVYLVSSNGAKTAVGSLANGNPVSLVTAGSPSGASSFELVAPGGTALPNRNGAARGRIGQASGSTGPAILGLTFTADGTFTGSATPLTLASLGGTAGSDGPVPPWALVVLGAGLFGIASRRIKSTG